MTLELKFCQTWPPQPGAPVLIRFGVDPCGQQITAHDVSVQAVLPPPVSSILIDLQQQHQVVISAPLGPLVSNIGVYYDINTWNGVLGQTCGAWEPATQIQGRQTCAPFRDATGYGIQINSRFQSAGVVGQAGTCSHWRQADSISLRGCAAWEQARREAADCLSAGWQQNERVQQEACGSYQEATGGIAGRGCFDWITLRRLPRPIEENRWSAATPTRRQHCDLATSATSFPASHCSTWQAGLLTPGWGGRLPPAPPEPPEPPCYNPTPGWAPIEMIGAYTPQAEPVLLFGCPGDIPPEPPGKIIVPVLRVYFMLNEARLFRVTDNTEIPVLSASAAIDASSWVWSVSATVPADALNLVQDDGAGPVELKLVINSHEFRLLAENLRRNRSFGSHSLTINGRGVAASLDAPYSDILTHDNASQARTAVQLMEDALTVNGVPLGWTVDATEITDWLIPAGVWSHTGSHISAINAIAGAINALVQADPTGQTIRIKPRYPHLPWRWAADVTPDIVLPENVVVNEGVEWLKSPSHNAVYVSGTSQGVLGKARIDGTAGDDYAEMVSHDLITHADAVRQRGSAILGATGRRQKVSLSMPIGGDTTLPVITPGTFIDYAPLGIGLTRGVRIDASRPAFRQTVDVEVYLGR